MSGAVDQNLQDKSCEVFYNEVCKANHPDKVDFARNCIEQHLMGTMRKTIREKCLSKMNQFFRDMKHQDPAMINQVPVPSMVLDCILAEHFSDELSLDIPFPSYESFTTLLSVISHRCPLLEKLTITFYGTQLSQTVPAPETVVILPHPHNSLLHLTELNLYNQPQANQVQMDSIKAPLYAVNESHRSILSVVGKFCPVLSHLVIRDFCIRKMDVIKLIVTEELAANIFFPSHVDDIASWRNDSILAGLRIPAAAFLNPLCFTLKEWTVSYECLSNSCKCYAGQDSFPEPAMAFALRHLTKLTHLDVKWGICRTALVVKQLYKAQKNPSIQAAFERDCREAAQFVGIEYSLSSSLLLPEFLSLTKLGYFPIAEEVTFRAIGALCPFLETVSLSGFDSENHSWDLDQRSVMITSRKLESSLNYWPKVRDLTLDDVIPQFLKPLLGALSTQLENLTLYNCDQVDMTALMPCAQLKAFRLRDFSLNSDVNPPAGLNSQNFLPNLEKIAANDCLQTWAPLFEGKRDHLALIRINCCHIGTNANVDSGWNQVPELWPQLVMIDVGQCTGLSMAMVAEQFPKMSKLDWIGLPESMTENEPAWLIEKINKEFSAKKNKKLRSDEDEEEDEQFIFAFSSDDKKAVKPCLFQS